MIIPTKEELLMALDNANTVIEEAQAAGNERQETIGHAAFYAISKALWNSENEQIFEYGQYIHEIRYTNGTVRFHVDLAYDAPKLDGFIAVKDHVDIADPDKPKVALVPAVKYININEIESITIKENISHAKH